MENFREELDLMLGKEAIVQVSAIDELQEQLKRLLDVEAYREKLQLNKASLTHNVEQVLEDYSKLILAG